MLKAKDMYVSLDGLEVLKGVTIEIERGEIVLVVGPNGSGKTTLFKSMMGLLKYRGIVELDGSNINKLKPHERFEKGIVLSPERTRLAEGLSVRENIEISGDFSNALEIFPELEKLENRRVENLSGGERQMVVFARAIISKPEFLLLDEPFQGVSDKNAKRMLESLLKISKKSGIAIISHERIEEIAELSSRIYLMLSGRIKKCIQVDDPEKAMGKLEKYMIV